jgi:bifunctional DNase/RNase
MISMQVRGLTFSDQGFVLMLGMSSASTVLPIFIGAPEAQAIAVALNHQEVARPLTHDLFKTVLETLRCALIRIEIYDLVENTFYGRLILLDAQQKTYSVDCRPSDAVALALRFNAPILVDEKVMASAAVTAGNKTPPAAPVENAGAPPQPALTTKELLGRKLQAAVAAEHYEEAARLRDELKKLSADN